MQSRRTNPIDGTELLNELTQNLTDQQKGMITQIIQGQNILSKYTIKDAVHELDELFDSK